MFRYTPAFLAALFLALLMLPATAMAQDFKFPIQGFLTDDAGAAVNGTVDIRFRLYDANEDVVHQEIAEITVTEGSFRYYLGSSTESGEELDADLFTQFQALQLGIRVGSDDEMSPRMAIERVPFAAHATFADHALVAAVAQEPEDYETVYRVTNSLCFETVGTLSFSSTCNVQNRNLDACPACGSFERKIRTCNGSCGCAQGLMIACFGDQICDNRSYGAQCPNEPVGRVFTIDD